MLLRVISGGQTGVDAAALRAAARTGIPTGGWCPKGWLTEDGPAPWLADFGLRETATLSYPARTRRNVEEADGTLILAMTVELTGGTALTQCICLQRDKPCMCVDLSSAPCLPQRRKEVLVWLREANVQVLNVAGPRESEWPGIGKRAEAFLDAVFKHCKKANR